MILLLARRNLTTRPGRSALLLAGFALGVAVMIVLLSIGEAMLAQSRDERLVGGGDVTVLPEGLDVEVMKTGGLGGMFFSIANARFIYLQLLAAPRLSAHVAAVAPQIEGKLLYLRAGGREHPVRATGEIPSRTAAVGAAPPLAAGAWVDDDGDRRWIAPTPEELRHDLDHFHLPPATLADASSWGEWHYFNVLSADGRRWAFISLIVGGDVRDTLWGGQVAITRREQGREEERFTETVGRRGVRFSTTRADLDVGASSVRVTADGRYVVRARGADGARRVTADLVLSPEARAYFPGASLGEGDDFVSGYAVPALRAEATGTICADGTCERLERVQAYHDHNWGVWRGVSWEWGAGRAGALGLLYGRVEPPAEIAGDAPLFLYVVDSLGFRALFRPQRVAYEDGRTIRVGGRAVRVPSRAVMADARGDDTLRVELVVEDAIGTDTRLGLPERGEGVAERRLARPYFIQMKGRIRVTGRIAGEPVRGEGAGFFETYR
ncbi:MAG TPA: ABC transporter permease [Gemmatimonadaceae bacterium]|nr:ABC transporter permease [Gemmatimonadaceae bacterium]